VDEPPEPAADEIAEDILTRERGHGCAAIDVAAGHGLSFGARIVVHRVDEIRLARAGGAGPLVGDLAFAAIPAVVAAALDDVDLLARALPDVRQPQRAAFAVEREAPWIAQPPCEELGAVRARRMIRGAERVSGERIARGAFGDRVGTPAVDVETQHGAEQVRRVLGAIARIARAAAVAEPDIKVAVGA